VPHIDRPVTLVYSIREPDSVPVAAPIVAAGRVQPSQVPATKVARTVFHGDYEGLGAAWGEFDAWIAANGHTPGPDLWERYVAGPESNPDPTTGARSSIGH
jgi:effector-binding domain-containing protein